MVVTAEVYASAFGKLIYVIRAHEIKGLSSLIPRFSKQLNKAGKLGNEALSSRHLCSKST